MEKKYKYEWMDLWKSKFGPNSHVSRHLLLYLSTWMDEEGGNCFPSRERISEDTGLSTKTISNHTGALAKTGWLKISKEHIGKKKERNTYYPNIPRFVLEKLKNENS